MKHSHILYHLFRFVFLLVALEAAGRTQPICRIRHYSVGDGVSQSFVQRICQTPDGLLWFGTWNGLNSYDGYTFTTHNMSSPGGEALSTNRITDLHAGSDGDLWCQTYDGRVYLFLSREQRFVDVLAPAEKRLGRKVAVKGVHVLSKGIVWIAGDGGCAFRLNEARFKDGTDSLRLYCTADGSLKGSRLLRVFEDSEGDEWLLTDGGVSIVGRKRVEDDSVFTYIKERNGRIYLVSRSNRLAVYRPGTSDFDCLGAPCPSPVTSLKSLGRDTLLVQMRDAVVFYSEKGGFSPVLRVGDCSRHSSSISNVCVEKSGVCWVLLDRNEVLRLNPLDMSVRLYALPVVRSNKSGRESRSLMFRDANRMLWVIPEHGAMCYYDEEADAFSPYLLDEQDASSVYVPFIRYSAFDRQGNLWFAPGTGLEKISFLSSFFTLHALEKEMDVRAFCKDRAGRLWIGSQSGVVRVATPGGRMLYLSPQGGLTSRKCVFSGGVYAVLEDSGGAVWIGTKKDGLFRLRPLSGGERYEVEHYVHDELQPHSLSSGSVYALFEDSRGRVWVGTFGGGLNLAVGSDGGRLRFVHPGNGLEGYPSGRASRIRCITEAPGGILLVGTTDGLLAGRVDSARPEDIRFTLHRHRAADVNSLNSNDIMGIFVRGGVKTSAPEVYALGFTGGLNIASPDSLLDRHTAAFRHYTEQDGLISNLVHSMCADGHGHCWIVAENGLSLFDPQTGRCINYRSDHFSPGLKFAETVPQLVGDSLFLGTNLGVLELHLSKLPHNTYVPPVLLTEVRLQGRLLHCDANRLEELVLPSHQRNVSFRFAAVEFINSANIRYAYRLKGLEKEWNEALNTRSANYMNLPAGIYTFEVRSTNSDGVWMDNVRTLRLVVEPKFTETAWAWVVYAAVFLLLVGTVCCVLFYIYRLRHRIDMEHQLADIKLRFFTDISHELRTPLTLISSPVNEALEDDTLSPKTRENLTLARINTQRMLRMMNQILDFRKMQNRKMKLLIEEADLLRLLRQVMEHFQAMARSKHIRFELSSPVPSLVMWLDVDKAEKVFFNLISNAFKYTPDGKAITVAVQSADAEVRVTVADQGIGIDAEHRQKLFRRFENFAHSDMWSPSSGIGLSLVKELVTLHHGHIDVESRVGEGSRFTVTLPLDKAVYARDKQVEFILNDGPSARAVPDEAQQAETAVTPAEDAPGRERLTVLVVEDNDELRLFLRNILSETYRVLEARDGRQGLTLAVKHVPDLIITDVMMPVMDGLDMVKLLKENRMVCHIPVIVLSAKSSLDDRIAGLEHGIDDYIGKPFSSTYLKARIVSLLKQRRQLQELYMSRLSEQESSAGKAQPSAYEPALPELESLDEQFMKSVMAFLEENMSNQELEIENLAEHLFMSRTVFYRKLKSITGLTPVEFVREIRLKRAVQLMDSDDYTISQVAYMTGFRAPKYFSKVFKKATGLTPSEYKEKKAGKS